MNLGFGRIKGLLCSPAKVFGDAVKAGWRLENVGVPTSSESELVVLGGEMEYHRAVELFHASGEAKLISYHFATRLLGYLSPRSFFRLTLDLLKPTECAYRWRQPPPARVW